jgi:hypothetical protein
MPRLPFSASGALSGSAEPINPAAPFDPLSFAFRNILIRGLDSKRVAEPGGNSPHFRPESRQVVFQRSLCRIHRFGLRLGYSDHDNRDMKFIQQIQQGISQHLFSIKYPGGGQTVLNPEKETGVTDRGADMIRFYSGDLVFLHPVQGHFHPLQLMRVFKLLVDNLLIILEPFEGQSGDFYDFPHGPSFLWFAFRCLPFQRPDNSDPVTNLTPKGFSFTLCFQWLPVKPAN